MQENNNSMWSWENLHVKKYSNKFSLSENISFAMWIVDFMVATKPIINVSLVSRKKI